MKEDIVHSTDGLPSTDEDEAMIDEMATSFPSTFSLMEY